MPLQPLSLCTAFTPFPLDYLMLCLLPLANCHLSLPFLARRCYQAVFTPEDGYCNAATAPWGLSSKSNPPKQTSEASKSTTCELKLLKVKQKSSTAHQVDQIGQEHWQQFSHKAPKPVPRHPTKCQGLVQKKLLALGRVTMTPVVVWWLVRAVDKFMSLPLLSLLLHAIAIRQACTKLLW